MADLSKFKKGRGLGAPPSLNEASLNLTAPEVAPSPMPRHEAKTSAKRVDGRTLRKTNRTIAFAARVTEHFDNRVREIAEESGLKIVEVLEAALEAYEQRNKKL